MIALALAMAFQELPAGQVSVSAVKSADLVTECERDRGMAFDPCTAYILGVADALQINRVTCRPPSDAASLQTVTIVRRFIKAHPEHWDWSPVTLVSEPLKAAFPCNR
jgi:hypothetical protein